jgi:peptide/nickel transport system substrate-binding protein/oligopeptide transport system substrate-binding protein
LKGGSKVSARWKASFGLLVAVALIASLSLAGCGTGGGGGSQGQSSTSEVQKGGTMSYYVGEPAYIDPYNTQESEGTAVEQSLFDSLTKVDPLDATKLLPSAAESWESNSDATVWTFKLNPKGTYSDGSPVTANDFIYAWNRIVNPKTVNTLTKKADPAVIGYHLAYVAGYDDVQSGKIPALTGMKAVDDYTLEITLSKPFADFAYVCAHPALAPVPQKYVEGGVDFNGEKVPFGDMPVGNGPFKMAEPWKHSQYIKVVANENYWGTKPNIDGVEFKIFKDVETAYTEFEAGTLDFTQVGEGKIKDAVAKYGESENGYTVNPGKQVLLGEENATYYMIFNEKDKTMSNQKLREALSLAINRQAICDVVFDGTRSPADNIVPPGIAGYVAGTWKNAKYDVDAAKQALADAGYPEGKGLGTIKLSFNSGAGHEKIMELIQADWKVIGVTSEFDSAEFAVYLKQLDAGKFQVARLGWIADYPIMDNFLYPLFTTGSGDNKSAYSNPDVDSGLEEARATTDQTARLQKYQDVNVTVAENLPVAPVMFYKHHHVGSNRLNNFTYDPSGIPDFVNVWITGGSAAK